VSPNPVQHCKSRIGWRANGQRSHCPPVYGRHYVPLSYCTMSVLMHTQDRRR
jgi:hypothetical protein